MRDIDSIRQIAASCVGMVGAPITALRKIVQEHRYIENADIRVVADVFNLSLADVRGIVSFYSDLRTTPRGRKHIRICQAEACQSVGARKLTSQVSEALGIELGETHGDGSVSLEAVYCLGLCASGPSATLNDRILVHASKEDLLA